ncbi:ABC transporter ATP-binding protein [Clostridium sartagoforme]|uniref:ABC transporter ATP-binding protein n=1 Tax=Clostridium sartagoforme TaxID=84031 RepID=A0A4S2DKV4_9CLOT|nr:MULTISPECIES: ABC transporter ATP-binding protein [Clostridium]MBS5939460.1 ABC transporter ATP-binding protein [Clostridium sp.]TGY42575.1 ABC transporter ATP-binding protein [Clostridium sartagoforme]
MSKVLEVNNVYKRIKGKSILNGVTLSVEQGRVLGIMGPNGQGKTTLLNVIQGFLKVNKGEIFIDGNAINTNSKESIAYLQDKNIFPKSMKIKEAISLYGNFFEDFNVDKMNYYLEFMNLDRNSKIKDLSKGMSEKFNLSLVLSRKAKLYLLDEPISGVDPVSREKILDAILENLSEESSMIITTHYIGELERIFDDVAFLGDGRIIEYDEAENLRAKYNASIDEVYRKIFSE